jgi:hypothetical protein
MASTFKALRQRADLQLGRVELADGEQPPACDLLSARSETHVALGGAGRQPEVLGDLCMGERLRVGSVDGFGLGGARRWIGRQGHRGRDW